MFARGLGRSPFRLPHAVPASGLDGADPAALDGERIGVGAGDFVYYAIFEWQDRKNPNGHAAGAVGARTILLFGPTPDRTLGRFPPNVRVMRAGLRCEPCWFARRLAACAGRVDCLDRLTADDVAAAIAATHTLTA